MGVMHDEQLVQEDYKVVYCPSRRTFMNPNSPGIAGRLVFLGNGGNEGPQQSQAEIKGVGYY
ncbi:hypothetical protein KY290_010571 [Solanum tuberosum]|uniref:Uncharacterized protein n=1 Tax=Solanum tuberosum TaxID=4113 RepID=A0ABQ7VY90_SOLTU|nr:hypothetical protein KY290_010571 [Solanum tuberosum]